MRVDQGRGERDEGRSREKERGMRVDRGERGERGMRVDRGKGGRNESRLREGREEEGGSIKGGEGGMRVD
eukprot:395414-Rhodomonas_salina.1